MPKKITYKNDAPYIKSIIAKDPLLKHLFDDIKQVDITISEDYFLSLVSAIISQQLSGKVAAVIYNRFQDYYEQHVTPKNILNSYKEDLRKLGISYQKIMYLKSLASAVDSGELDLDSFQSLDNEMIIEKLIKIKGIGRWTAQMFLMFSLGRQDVTAPLDLGLRKAYRRLCGKEVSVKEFSAISDGWKPYRSIVSYFLWHSIDKPKEDKA